MIFLHMFAELQENVRTGMAFGSVYSAEYGKM